MAKIQAVWRLISAKPRSRRSSWSLGNARSGCGRGFRLHRVSKILSQPDADPDELVRKPWRHLPIATSSKVASRHLGSRPIRPGQFIKLPPVEKKRIPDIVKFEAKQQIPFALDEVVWAYQQIGGDAEVNEEEFTMAEVGLFAMKRDQINRAFCRSPWRGSRSRSCR